MTTQFTTDVNIIHYKKDIRNTKIYITPYVCPKYSVRRNLIKLIAVAGIGESQIFEIDI